jgi:hypothetical protein
MDRGIYRRRRWAARRVRTGLRRKVGVRNGGGQLGNNVKVGCSLDVDKAYGCRASLGAESRREACRRRVAAGGAAWCGDGGHQDPLPSESPVRRFRLNSFPTQHLLGTATRSMCATPSLVGTHLSTRVPQTLCPGLSLLHIARKGDPLAAQNRLGGYGWIQRDQT